MKLQTHNKVYVMTLTLFMHLSFAFDDNLHMRYLNNINPLSTTETQEIAVEKLIERLLPQDHHKFKVSVDPSISQNKLDSFKINKPISIFDKRVGIQGNTGVAVAWALLYYLKNYCNCSVSWEANQLDLPQDLPEIHVKIVAQERFRYYENVCTVSYSFTWWDWPDWSKHIDWMALNGVNFALAFVGQEALWKKVYMRFNLTENDLNEHFAGPGFLAWGRMGNIKNWGGPLTSNWHNRTLTLQHKILKRMTDLGIIPIFPAFAGHVPTGLTRIFPNVKVYELEQWNHFNGNYTGTLLLSPTEDLFTEIGSAFIDEIKSEFGFTSHVYNCDIFNELTPPDISTTYLRKVGKAIFKSMKKADSKAIWVMQGWLFRNEIIWTKRASKALITSVPLGKMLILDLTSEIDPQYFRLDSYFGQPFIFCMLHNYGGVNGFYGNAQSLLQNLEKVRSSVNMTLVGTGLTPEGIFQNYVIYDFMLDLGWRKTIENISEWAENYALRRYGVHSENLAKAWIKLMNSVYNSKDKIRFHGNYILMQRRPDFRRENFVWYKIKDFLNSWDLFVSMITTSKDENQYSKKRMKINLNKDGIGMEAKNTAINITAGDKMKRKFLGEDENHQNTLQTTLKFQNFEQSSFDFEDKVTFSNMLIKRFDKYRMLNSNTFRHDLLDVTRQALQLLSGKMIVKLRIAYLRRNLLQIVHARELLLNILDDLEKLLGTSKYFSLSSWLDKASKAASNSQEREQYLKNARYQISLWGPNGEILDYAVKQWNGVISAYFKPRWNLFSDNLIKCVLENRTFNQSNFDKHVFKTVEKPFAESYNFHVPEKGDLIKIVREIYRKYRKLFKKYFRIEDQIISVYE